MPVIPLLGIGLLGFLLSTIDAHALATHARTIGWGLLLVTALGGVSHLVKTWAWRLILRGERRKISFRRTFALRLISEAIAQLGFIGMVGGETTRVTLLRSSVSMDAAISSVTLDRFLLILSGAAVSVAGLSGLMFVVPLSHGLRWYAAGLSLTLVCLLIAGAVGIKRRWPVFSATASAGAWIPGLNRWFKSREAIVHSSEERLVDFYQESPEKFWLSLLLNFVCHFLAVTEVYVCLRMLGAHATLAGAFILEALTKLINVAGAVNPGNIGTYEAGNMAIGKLLRLTRSQGLLLALCRRFRAILWAMIGVLCLIYLSRRRNRELREDSCRDAVSVESVPAGNSRSALSSATTAFILAHTPGRNGFEPALAEVGTIPVLLRTVLQLQRTRTVRTVIVLSAANSSMIRRQLAETGRLPVNLEWMEVTSEASFGSLLRQQGQLGERVVFVSGSCSYRPALFEAIDESNQALDLVEYTNAEKPLGLFVLSRHLAMELVNEPQNRVVSEMDLHRWMTRHANSSGAPASFRFREVETECWQPITNPEDRAAAERKLDQWLTKPTDGIFARMNRRVSIPISRVLIKTPITPNMVSFCTLAFSIVGGVFFGLGGYWNCLAGAALGVLTSILDGCDGEVARLKLQVSDFGCWLDSICDYGYYIVTFAGMVVGVVRSTGNPEFYRWGMAIFAGACMTFVMASIGRRRLAGDCPEQYLAVWQKRAESKSAGLILRLARHAEFVVRRCFLPYFLLAFAIFNLMPAILYMAAFGANVAWIVSLRSVLVFSSRCRSEVATAQAADPLS